jgi:hypothetical protein
MAKIDRFPGNLLAFASQAQGTERTVFGDTAQADDLASNINSDFYRGWGIVPIDEPPVKQDFNALGYTLGQLLAYVHQMGMPEWSGQQEYHAGSMVNREGAGYRCLTDNHVNATPPESDGVNWELSFSGSASESIKGILLLATQLQVDAGLNTANAVVPKTLRNGVNSNFSPSSGHIKFPTWLGGFTIQWGVAPSVSPGNSTTTSFSVPFSNQCFQAIAIAAGTSATTSQMGALKTSFTNKQVTVYYDGTSGLTVTPRFIAVGY